jgi:hypothetical protein
VDETPGLMAGLGVKGGPTDFFFLRTEDILLLLAHPTTLSAPDREPRRVVQPQHDLEPEHVLHASTEWETVITYDDMIGFGWKDLQVRWLLSQIGVVDDQADDRKEAAYIVKKKADMRRMVLDQVENALRPVAEDVDSLKAAVAAQTEMIRQLLALQTKTPDHGHKNPT